MNASIVTQPYERVPAFISGMAPTMSSREIAELVGSRHDKVKQSIERLAERGLIVQPPVGDEHDSDSMGRPRTTRVYRIGKRDSYVIVAQLSPEFTARLVDRWQELESQVRVPGTFAEALRLAAEQAERIEQQQAALTAAAPKVDFVDRYATANGSKGFREVCKLLGANEAHFRLFLVEEKIAYRLGGVLTPHQNHIDAGRFEVKTGISTANEHAFNQMRFTPKGITWAAGEWAKYRLRRQEEAA